MVYLSNDETDIAAGGCPIKLFGIPSALNLNDCGAAMGFGSEGM